VVKVKKNDAKRDNWKALNYILNLRMMPNPPRSRRRKGLGETQKIGSYEARNQDFIWGGANEAKVDQTTEMYFLLSDPFIQESSDT